MEKFFDSKLLSARSGKMVRFRRYKPLDTSVPHIGLDINSGASGISIGSTISDYGEYQDQPQYILGSPGFTDKLI